MDDVCTYHIEIQGRVTEQDLNTMSPLRVTVERARPASMRFAVSADQSGLIGLLRHLHGRGLVLFSVHRDR